MRLDRARALIEHGRFEEALAALKKHASEDPGSAQLWALTAVCYIGTEHYADAIKAAQRAIHADPNAQLGHHALGYALLGNDQVDEAFAAARNAARLAPQWSEPRFLMSRLHLQQRNWPEALAAAETGLELDPESDTGVSLRAFALRQLGRTEEARSTAMAALKLNPESADALALRGTLYLDEGAYDEAAKLFREALRIEPHNDWAKSGVVSVIKAKSVFFRPLLRFQLWAEKQTQATLWGLIIGGLIVARVLKSIAKSNQTLEAIILPILMVYALFVLMTWMGEPVFSSLIRLHPLGRLTIDTRQRQASNGLIGCALLAAAATVVWAITRQPAFGWMAVACAALVIPVTVSLGQASRRPRKILIGYTLFLVASLIVSFALYLSDVYAFKLVGGLFVAGLLVFLHVSNLVISKWA